MLDFLQPRERMKLEWLRNQVPPDPKRGAWERVIEKTRTMMGSWVCVGKITHLAMTIPGTQYLFQSQTQEKAEDLITYAKILWGQQADWLKMEFPLDRNLSDLPKDLIAWANGSQIKGIPNDPDKVRAHHPTGMLMDECRYISDFNMNRQTALPAVRFLIMLSTCGAGEFADFKNA